MVQVESHPYLPEWDLLEYCHLHGIVLLAFAALAYGMEPRLLDDPVIIGIAQRLRKTPAQVVLAWAVQRGTALLTTSVTPSGIQENFELSTISEDAPIVLQKSPTNCRSANHGQDLDPKERIL